MRKNSIKNIRINEEVMRELSNIIRGEIKDPRINPMTSVVAVEVAQDSFDTHAYLNDLRYGNETKESEQFQRRLDRYRERYLFPDSDTAPAAAKEEPNK